MNPGARNRANLLVVRARLSILVCVALLLAACGGGKSATTTTAAGATPEDWAGGVCTAVNTYQLALQNAATTFTQNPSKSGIQDAVSSAQQATHTLSTTLKGLGKPNTASGQAARKTINDLATSISNDMATVKQASKGSTAEAATSVLTTVGSMKSSITTAVNTVENLNGGELKSAFASAPSCAKLKSKK